MNLNLDEVESAPVRRSGSRAFLWLVVGVALGVAGTLLLPRYIDPLLPAGLRGAGELVDGVVLDMRRDGDKLLITVNTEKGAVLATFTRRVPEVELLVGGGDTLTLGLARYAPFVDDPSIAAVRKSHRVPEAGSELMAEEMTEAGLPVAGAPPRDDAAGEDSVTEGEPAVAGDTAAVADTTAAADSMSAS